MKRNCPRYHGSELRKCFSCGHTGHRTRCQGLFPGKLQRGVRTRSGQRALQLSVALIDITLVTTTKNKLATVHGELCGVPIDIMLDSGSSVSLIRQDVAHKAKLEVMARKGPRQVKLVTASGAVLPILKEVEARVNFDGLESPVLHSFLVVKDLVSPVIVGVDFLRQQGLSLDFTFYPVRIYCHSHQSPLHPVALVTAKECATAEDPPKIADTPTITSKFTIADDLHVEECTIPSFKSTDAFIMPVNADKSFQQLLEK